MRMNSNLFDQSGFYPSMLLIGEGEEQPGPELLAAWYLRNAKIVNKLAQVTRPGDRVVVVYGAGHLALMRQMIADAPGMELEPVLPYLDRAADGRVNGGRAWTRSDGLRRSRGRASSRAAWCTSCSGSSR